MKAARRMGFWIALVVVVALVSLGHYWMAFLLFAVVGIPTAFARLAHYQQSLGLDPPDSGAHYGPNHYRP